MSSETFTITFTKNPNDTKLNVNCIFGNINLASTFDGGKQGYDILKNNISRALENSNFIPPAVAVKLGKLKLCSSRPVIFSSTRGSSLTAYEQEFITRFEKLKYDNANTNIRDSDKRQNAEDFASYARKWYDGIQDNEQQNDSIEHLRAYFDFHDEEKKYLKKHFYVDSSIYGTIGKNNTTKLDSVFKKLLQYNYIGGSRKTLKKQI